MQSVRYEPKCMHCEHMTKRAGKHGTELPACRKHIQMPCENHKDFSRQPGSDDDRGEEIEG